MAEKYQTSMDVPLDTSLKNCDIKEQNIEWNSQLI